MCRKRKAADLLKKAAQNTTSQTLHQFFSPGPSKKIMTGRDTTQPAEEAAADEEECRIMSQSAPCPVSEAECTVHVEVASSGYERRQTDISRPAIHPSWFECLSGNCRRYTQSVYSAAQEEDDIEI